MAMTKDELVSKVAKETSLKKVDVENVLDGLFTVVSSYMSENKTSDDECKKATSVRFGSFGTFFCTHVEGRTGINPRNPEEKIDIPDGYRIFLSSTKKFKDTVNELIEAKKTKKKKEEKPAKKATKAEKAKAVKGKSKPAKKPVVDEDDDEDEDEDD